MSRNKKPANDRHAFQLPRGVVGRLNLGQAFAEYDRVLLEPGVFVRTPALAAAEDPARSKCFFVGRRGTGKTAIARHLAALHKNVIELHPQVLTSLGGMLDPSKLRDTRQQPARTLVSCFRRALLDELVAEWVRRKLVSFNNLPDELRRERNFIDDFDFDSRAITFVDDANSALASNNQKDWIRQVSRAKAVSTAINEAAEDRRWNYLLLIDRLDDTWDGSDTAVVLLMALMHACLEIASSVPALRPLLFLRENVFERVRQIDNEFARLETCVVSLDWTEPLLIEMVERRLQRSMNPKPPLGQTWDLLFERMGEKSSRDFVFEFCQQRPRDILRFCSLAIESAQGQRHEKIAIEDLQDARRLFSDQSLKDLCDEYSENFPQIQLVINRFHGLAVELTLGVVESFLKKLLVDREIAEFCKEWIYEYTAPNRFIDLLYGIGFIGIKQASARAGEFVTEFRSHGSLSAPTPAITDTTRFVVHPTYVDALKLQQGLLSDLADDVALRQEGLILELPGNINLAEYEQRLDEVDKRLAQCPEGDAGASDFEEIVGDVIRYCFFAWLSNVQPKQRDVSGRVIRDWISANVARAGFWEMVRTRYRATQIVWECKNYSTLDASAFHQIAYYMTEAIGRFGIICFRGDRTNRSHYLEHIRRISTQTDGGIVLLIAEQDLRVFIRQAKRGGAREEHIRGIYDETVRAIS